MAVFEGQARLEAAFVEAFSGTAPDCFDDGKPVARPGGQL